MAYLNTAGLTTLWNKIKSTFEQKGKLTIDGTNYSVSIKELKLTKTDGTIETYKVLAVNSVVPPTPTSDDYVTFSSSQTFGLTLNNPQNDGTLQYSTNASTWNTWDGSQLTGSDTYYIRGTGNTTFATDDSKYSTFNFGNATNGPLEVECTGNIETLLDYETVADGEHPEMAPYCFRGLFQSQNALITAPELPTVDLANNCYEYMFVDCTSLTAAPELPATTLQGNCYKSMFEGCMSLITPPELPATTMANSCYANMFQDCGALETAPSLPGSVLSPNCYEYMFSGCASLTTPPALPALILTTDCYYSMFSDCSSLNVSTVSKSGIEEAWRIPTSGTGVDDYGGLSSMFYGTIGGIEDGTLNTTYYTQNTPV